MWQWRAVSKVHSQTALLGWSHGAMIRRINHEGASRGVQITPKTLAKALTQRSASTGSGAKNKHTFGDGDGDGNGDGGVMWCVLVC